MKRSKRAQYQALVAAVREDIKENCEVTSEDLQQIIAEYGVRRPAGSLEASAQ